MSDRRYPFANLAAAMCLAEYDPEHPYSGDRSAAETLGVTRRTLYRWKAEGLSEDQAEKLAVRAGLHAVNVWPDWGQKPCAECSEPFWPVRKDQKFCRPLCNRRWWARESKRRRYQRDPEFAERMRERRRAYYATCGEYERRRQRAYDRSKRSGEAA